MGYLKIDNLYRPKAQTILALRECHALEKVHGTSAHIAWDGTKLAFFSGGSNRDTLMKFFERECPDMESKFMSSFGDKNAIVYGEAYGGKCQRMSLTYGDQLRFIVFDATIGAEWLSVANCHDLCLSLGLEFVPFTTIPATIDAIDAEMMKPSEVARRRGITEDKIREGVVIRPVIELMASNGSRIIAKHKHPSFRETATERPVLSAGQIEVMSIATAIADEWVTQMRLTHILDKMIDPIGIESTGVVIKKMIEDIKVESKGEIVWSRDAVRAIGSTTAKMVKERLVADGFKIG
jgi:hypothetical protein